MIFLKGITDFFLLIRYFKSWEYRSANYMFYCEDCESYSRDYQKELKKLSSHDYNKALEQSQYGEISDICPHCLSESVMTIGHNDVKGVRKPWLDYDKKAPKLTLNDFIHYLRTVRTVKSNEKDMKDIEEYLRHNKLIE